MDLNFQRAFELLSESEVNKMEEERIFVAFASKNDVDAIQMVSAKLTREQLDFLYWLYENDLLNGKFEEYNPDSVMGISEP